MLDGFVFGIVGIVSMALISLVLKDLLLYIDAPETKPSSLIFNVSLFLAECTYSCFIITSFSGAKVFDSSYLSAKPLIYGFK